MLYGCLRRTSQVAVILNKANWKPQSRHFGVNPLTTPSEYFWDISTWLSSRSVTRAFKALFNLGRWKKTIMVYDLWWQGFQEVFGAPMLVFLARNLDWTSDKSPSNLLAMVANFEMRFPKHSLYQTLLRNVHCVFLSYYTWKIIVTSQGAILRKQIIFGTRNLIYQSIKVLLIEALGNASGSSSGIPNFLRSLFPAPVSGSSSSDFVRSQSTSPSPPPDVGRSQEDETSGWSGVMLFPTSCTSQIEYMSNERDATNLSVCIFYNYACTCSISTRPECSSSPSKESGRIEKLEIPFSWMRARFWTSTLEDFLGFKVVDHNTCIHVGYVS